MKERNGGVVEIVKYISSVVATCRELIAMVVIVNRGIQAITSVVKSFVKAKTLGAPPAVFRGLAGLVGLGA